MQNHNYASHMIYDCGFEDASTLIRELMGDNEFLEFNAKQHNRFRAAFKKYLKWEVNFLQKKENLYQ